MRSITTDYGVELSIGLLCDIIPAFLDWVNGASLGDAAHFINRDQRLMPNALRIGGWSHSIGNVMKGSGNYFPSYALWLGHLRSLCRFFRVGSYRSHLVRMVGNQIPGLADTLKGFTAGFAKWRYETLDDCMMQLLKLRVLCEEHMVRCIFNQVKDIYELDSCLKTCSDRKFWKWMAACYEFLIHPLERLRRWGLLCPCHEQERRDPRLRQKVRMCAWNSRRLATAWSKIKSFVAELRAAANELRLDQCGDDTDLHTWLVNSMRACAADVLERFKYLSVVPWAFSMADTVEGAIACLQQWRARPPGDHDSMTRDVMSRLEGAIEVVANGWPVSEEFKREVYLINTCPCR